MTGNRIAGRIRPAPENHLSAPPDRQRRSFLRNTVLAGGGTLAEVVIWVSVDGRATLYGAVAGAGLVNYAKTYLTAALPEVWLFALGGLFVLVAVFLPRGLVGLVRGRKELP